MSGGEKPEPGKNRRARRITAIAVLVVALAFVVSSTWQIISAVFFARPVPIRAETPDEIACVSGLRRLEAALERATDRAAHATMANAPILTTDEAHALEAFEAALAPEWDDQASVERTCSSTTRGKEAWAALLRLRRGLEGSARKDAHEIGPLRRDFETRLP